MKPERNRTNIPQADAPPCSRLFIASCIALAATSMSFAIRGDILGELGTRFALNKAQLGLTASAWAYGFTLAIFFGGQLVDLLGLGRILALAFLMHVLGIAVTIFATGFTLLFAGTLSVGFGNGLVEAAVNPLVATVYSRDKAAKLNHLHAWFPGGIVIGGLAAFAMSRFGFAWQAKMAVLLIPVAAYGLMFLGQRFPFTERVQCGVSALGMYREILRPLFFLLVGCMILTASTELAPGQWIPTILSNTVPGLGASSILVLVWINGLMALGRMFAGPIVRRLSPIGLLAGAAAFAALGLYLLSVSNSALLAVVAATLFAVGVCYFWPTMLGITSQRLPRGGALALAIICGSGNLSVAIFTWIMGGVYEAAGPRQALRSMVILPVLLIGIFTAIWLSDRTRGGYNIDRLRQHGADP